MNALMLKIAASSGVHVDDVHKAMGIKDGMSADEIKKAKRKFALDNHPDRNPGKDSSFYTKIMSGFDDHYDQDHKRKASSRDSWGWGRNSDNDPKDRGRAWGSGSGSSGQKPPGSDWASSSSSEDPRKREAREKADRERREKSEEKRRASTEWHDQRKRDREKYEEEFKKAREERAEHSARREAERDAYHRDKIKRDINGLNRSAKSSRNANLAGSVAYGALTIGGHHLVQKHHEGKGHHEEAALIKKIKRRQMIGQGVGWLGGAVIGHHLGKRHINKSLLDNPLYSGYIRSAIGDQGVKDTLRASSQEGAARFGSHGQFAGSIGAAIASHKLSKQLSDSKEARERVESEKRKEAYKKRKEAKGSE
jgi:hypothetical protein